MINRARASTDTPGHLKGAGRHGVAVQRLADQVVFRLADRLHPDDTSAARPVATDSFCAAILDGDDTLALAMARQALVGTQSLRSAFLDTLTPASRQLGQMWIDDDISFLQLSMAAGRIFSIMRSLRRDIPFRIQNPKPGHLALFAAVPGEEHTMGVTMAADLFREQGWHVDLRTGATVEMLIADAERNSYPVIGLSAGHPGMLPALTGCIRALRRALPAGRILVSGHLVDTMPGVGNLVGADAAATDFDSMLSLCEGFVAV